MIRFLLVLLFSAPVLAGNVIYTQDGRACIVSNNGKQIISCDPPAQSKQKSSSSRSNPQNCADLQGQIASLKYQSRHGNKNEFREAQRLLEQYENTFRRNCR